MSKKKKNKRKLRPNRFAVANPLDTEVKHIDADYMASDYDGALVFYDVDQNLVACFAKGFWKNVERV